MNIHLYMRLLFMVLFFVPFFSFSMKKKKGRLKFAKPTFSLTDLKNDERKRPPAKRIKAGERYGVESDERCSPRSSKIFKLSFGEESFNSGVVKKKIRKKKRLNLKVQISSTFVKCEVSSPEQFELGFFESSDKYHCKKEKPYELEKFPEKDLLSFDACKERHAKGEELTYNEFKSVAELFVNMMSRELSEDSCWVFNQAPQKDFFDITQAQHPKKFFGQKILLDEAPEIWKHGDYHGDVDSLFADIDELVKRGILDKNNPFKIRKEHKNFYMAFLGDYMDRGWYSISTLYLILRLKLENPRQVIILRGNHEDVRQNESDFRSLGQISKALGSVGRIGVLYNMLPSFVCIGVKGDVDNYALLCHGGLEPRFNMHTILSDERDFVYQWIDILDISYLEKFNNNLRKGIISRMSLTKDFSEVIENPGARDNGFMWSDFMVDDYDDSMVLVIPSYRAKEILSFGKKATLALLHAWSTEKYVIRVVFRAHQHADPAMRRKLVKNKGICNLWAPPENGFVLTPKYPVWTLNVSPNTKGNQEEKEIFFDFDTFTILKMDREIEKWILSVFNLKIKVKKKEDDSWF